MRRNADSILLCARCGYSLEGLEATAVCPECGAPASASMPEFRTGSPWQERPAARTWIQTVWRTLMNPIEMMARLRIDVPSSQLLLLANCAVAALVLGGTALSRRGSWMVPSLANRSPIRDSATVARESLGYVFLATALGSLLVLVLLTWIEQIGVRFFAARRGWRVTRPIAIAVTAHASAGWIVAAVLVPLGWSIAELVEHPVQRLAPDAWRDAMTASVALLPLAGFLLGLVWFETLVYLGVRQCRFANIPRSPDGEVPAATVGAGAWDEAAPAPGRTASTE